MGIQFDIGECACLALLDATELALAIVAHGDDTETTLTQYEAALFPRAATAAEQSAQGLDLCVATDAPQGMAISSHACYGAAYALSCARNLLRALATLGATIARQ